MDGLNILFGLWGIIGTCIAIYQFAVQREGKKRKQEIQYVIASVNNSALQKQQSWHNQITTYPKFETENELEIVRILLRARDDFQEIVSMTVALEGTIDVDNSAITSMMEKSIKIVKQNNELQKEGLKNPHQKSESTIENDDERNK